MAAGTDKLKSYHFDLGNSSTGSIGMCARVKANSAEAALASLKKALETLHGIELKANFDIPDEIEYLNVYTNPEMITPNDIDEEEDTEDDENDIGGEG